LLADYTIRKLAKWPHKSIMKIYVSHKRRSNFETVLYNPLKNSVFAKEHTFVFPHENNPESFNAKELLANKKIDLVLAEVSEPATGQGIELAWAQQFDVPIICFYKSGSDISGSLKFLTDNFISYSDTDDMIKQIEEFIKTL
jgi:hypothetical protein